MEGILTNILVWIVGFIILAAIVGIINLVIRGVNRAAQGAERVDAIALVCHSDTISKYVSEATSGGTGRLDTKRAITKLFGYAVSDSKLEQWTKSGIVIPCLLPQADTTLSQQQAVEIAGREIARSGIPRDRLQKDKVYSIESRGTDTAHTAYLVIAGNLPSSPIQFGVSPF